MSQLSDGAPCRLPPLVVAGKFFKFAGPIFFALLGKTLCYSALGVAAQQCGTVPLAGTTTHTKSSQPLIIGKRS
jgi:hypothetical protein